MYGAGVFGLYFLLGRIGAPTFYDKLLVVPPLNLMVRAIDRWAAAVEARLHFWTPLRANLAHMAIWIALFAVMAGTGFVGGRHPGADPEFWRQACEQGRRNACLTWAHTLDIACAHGSGSACLGLGMLVNESGVVPRDTAAAGKDFGRGCDLGVAQACRSLVALVQKEGQDVFAPGCNRGDGESCFVLGSLAYAGRGVPKDPVRAMALFGQACSSGWPRGCGALGECYRAAADTTRAVESFEKACRAGIAPSCYAVATIYRSRNDELLAQQRFRQACESSTRFAATNAAYFKSGAAGSAANPAFCSQSNP